ncbi:MAG: carboxypeptidase-like regulatory domain-containing protein [Fibrobacterales bacterium]
MLNLKWIFLMFISVVVTSCSAINGDDSAGGGTETGNMGGKIIASDNITVAGAEVQLFVAKRGVDSLGAPPVPVQQTLTDANGNYSFNVTEQNTYTIVAKSLTESAFVDSLIISPDTDLRRDIGLKIPGSISGEIRKRVELLKPSAVMAYLVGTSMYVNLSDTGTFAITDVPEGTYTLMLIPNQEYFSNTVLTVQVQSGLPTIIAEPIELQYNSIPIPENVEAVYNGASGGVTVTWTPVSYEHFQEYLVERNLGSNLEPQWILVGRTIEPQFNDVVYGATGDTIFTLSDTTSHSLEYRVRVRSSYSNLDGSSMDGSAYGKSILAVQSPKVLIPVPVNVVAVYDTLLGVATITWDSIPDSLVVSYMVERVEMNDSINQWDSSDTIVESFSGTTMIDILYQTNESVTVDTASYDWQYLYEVQKMQELTALDVSYPTYAYRVSAQVLIPSSGELPITGRSTESNTINTAPPSIFNPIVTVSGDTVVAPNTSVTVTANATSLKGVVSNEWKIGNGEWVEGLTATFITGPGLDRETVLCHFRAVNSIGDTASKYVSVRKEVELLSFSLPDMQYSQGSATNFSQITTGKKYVTGRVTYDDVGVWSSEGLKTWTLESHDLFEGKSAGLNFINDEIIAYVISDTCNWNDSSAVYCKIAKGWRSDGGKNWEIIEPIFEDSTVLKRYVSNGGKFVNLLNTIFLAQNVDSTIHIQKTIDGVSWDKFIDIEIGSSWGMIDMFEYQGNFCYSYQKARKCLVNMIWEDIPLWDADYAEFPDQLTTIATNGQRSIVIYYDEISRQSNIKYTLDGLIWNTVPSYLLETTIDKISSTYSGGSIAVTDEYFLYTYDDWDNKRVMKGFKIP